MTYRHAIHATIPSPKVHGTVLIVDDDPVQRREVASCLARTGIHVVECGHGDFVMAMIEEATPDLVLLDINLPGRHGDELALDIHTRYPNTKVLLMTARSQSMFDANAAHLPVFAVLEKPVPLRALIRFVSSAIAATRGAHWNTDAGNALESRPLAALRN